MLRTLDLTRKSSCLMLQKLCKTSLQDRLFSCSTALLHDKVYELRTYNIKPQYTKMFLADLNKWVHVRLAHSKMVGFWMSEIGGMNDLLHLWEYDNLAHRARVRQLVGSDETWQKDFISKILPMLSRQDNCVVKCLPGTELNYPSVPGVYEIQHFSLDSFDLTNIGRSVLKIDRPGAMLVGSFYSIVGNLSSGFLLWHHADLDKYNLDVEGLQKIEGVTFGHSRILLPLSFSELK